MHLLILVQSGDAGNSKAEGRLHGCCHNVHLWRKQVDEEKEAKKLQRARMVLAGHAFTDDDDPFEGLTPQVLPPLHLLYSPCEYGDNRQRASILYC